MSLPLVTLAAIGRATWCVLRCGKAGRVKSAVLAGLGIVMLACVFAAVAVAWFAYGVAHTGKDAGTDLMVLGTTGAAIYAAALGLWRGCLFMEHRGG